MDLIKLVLDRDNTDIEDFIEYLSKIPEVLNATKGKFLNNEGVSHISGKIKNMKFRIEKDRLTLGEFSLNKWTLGNNMDMMRRIDIEKGIRGLSKLFGLPIENARVVSFEFGRCIITENRPKCYLPYMCSSGRYKRVEASKESLYYKKENKVLCFYDKTKEMKRKRRKNEIPEEYKNKHVMRYEIRYKKRLNKQFNVPYVSASMLWDETFYKGLVQDWESQYNAISKQPITNFDTNSCKTKSRYAHLLGMNSIQQIGCNKLLQEIEERKTKGLITNKQAHDQMDYLIECMSIELKQSGNDLIEELDVKMREAALC